MMDDETPTQVEQRLATDRGITIIDGTTYGVLSSDGRRRYNVRFAGRGDSGEVRLWSCDCPAGLRGRHCRHVDEVSRLCAAVADETGMD